MQRGEKEKHPGERTLKGFNHCFMKIAIYSGAIPSTTFIEHLIKGVAASGQEVYLFGKLRKQVRYDHPGIHIHPTPEAKVSVVLFVLWNQIRLWLQSPQRFYQLAQHIRSVEPSSTQRWRLWAKYLPVVRHLPDIFHIQWAKATAEWLFLKDLFGVKLVLSLRGTHINYSPIADAELAASYRRSFPKLDGFHAVSKAIAREAMAYSADPDKVNVFYSGIDFTHLKPFEKKDYKVKQPLQLLSVGRWHWVKGYHYALDALRLLLDRGHELHYTIIAGTPSEEILYQLHELELQPHVTIIGQLPQHEVFQYMQQADLLLLPSVEEGIANVVLEAMALGLPVLSSDCGGMEEVIQHKVNGFLFENRNTDELAENILQYLRLAPAERASMAAKARTTVHQQHRLQQMVTDMLQLYQSVIHDHSSHENRIGATGAAGVL